jgi:hypothetical protein
MNIARLTEAGNDRLPYQDERENEVPCDTTWCEFWDERFEQNCEAQFGEEHNRDSEGDPFVTMCHYYVPNKLAAHVESKPDGYVANEDILAIIDSSICWWELKRPLEWGTKEHLENAEINCDGEEEKRLARSVAKIVRASYLTGAADGGRKEG